MTRGLMAVGVSCCVVCSCAKAPELPMERVALRSLDNERFELIPSPGQLPYCLVYSVSSQGVTRQMTMSAQNVSFECPAGLPIGGHPFRVLPAEGEVAVHVLFSSQPVQAASLTQQLMELGQRQQLSAMDFRVPGALAIQTLKFAPQVQDSLGQK